MSPTAAHIPSSSETFGACRRLRHSGRMQAGLQYHRRRWRAIPAELHTRFRQDDFLTLPVGPRRASRRSCASGAAKPASPSARQPCGTRGVHTGHRRRGSMPPKPASTPHTETLAPPVRDGCPRHSPRYHALTSVGSRTRWHITPFHHTEGNYGGQSNVGRTGSTCMCWSMLACRRTRHACHRRRTFLWVGSFCISSPQSRVRCYRV
jgi:hypothetical protein